MLKLPESLKIGLTFNLTLLERYSVSNPNIQIIDIKAVDAGCKIELIIAIRPSHHNPKNHVYLVEWEGYAHLENMCEMYENVLECSLDLWQDYYGINPKIDRDG
jgi:hypothetical protein